MAEDINEAIYDNHNIYKFGVIIMYQYRRYSLFVVLLLLILILVLPSASLATNVGGIINTNTSWTLSNSPYVITQVVQVASGVTLTIEPGVVVNTTISPGDIGQLALWGSLHAIGTSTQNIIFNGITIKACAPSPSLTVQFGRFNGGNINQGPSGNYVNFSLRDSYLKDLVWLQLGDPTQDAFIERNIFLRSQGIGIQKNIPSNAKHIYIRSNLFLEQQGSWGLYVNNISAPANTIIIENNSFINPSNIAIRLYPLDPNFSAINNFWNTTDTNVIDAMIYDRKDTLEIAGYVQHIPFLTLPHPDTPFLNINQEPDEGWANLADIIKALQVISGMTPAISVYNKATINGDGKIGLEEVIYFLQCIARLRNNHSPILSTIGNKAVDENSTLSFTISSTDPDGDIITYSASTLPSGATFNATNKIFSWTPTYSQSGTYPVTFTARDDYGGSASETITITVNNKIPVFGATDYFPLNIGDWQDFKYASTSVIHRSYTTGPRYIGGIATKERTYWDGQREYYTSDANGVKMYGQYVISQDYTGEVYFNTPLLLIPNNAQLGTTQVSNSSYTITVSGYVFHVNITSTASILGLEDVQTANSILRDCVKGSLHFDQYIVETGQSVPGSTVYYWFYKGVGGVKQVVGSDTYTITGSYINGVQQTY